MKSWPAPSSAPPLICAGWRAWPTSARHGRCCPRTVRVPRGRARGQRGRAGSATHQSGEAAPSDSPATGADGTAIGPLRRGARRSPSPSRLRCRSSAQYSPKRWPSSPAACHQHRDGNRDRHDAPLSLRCGSSVGPPRHSRRGELRTRADSPGRRNREALAADSRRSHHRSPSVDQQGHEVGCTEPGGSPDQPPRERIGEGVFAPGAESFMKAGVHDEERVDGCLHPADRC